MRNRSSGNPINPSPSDRIIRELLREKEHLIRERQNTIDQIEERIDERCCQIVSLSCLTTLMTVLCLSNANASSWLGLVWLWAVMDAGNIREESCKLPAEKEKITQMWGVYGRKISDVDSALQQLQAPAQMRMQ